jgi:hypothetical protein
MPTRRHDARCVAAPPRYAFVPSCGISFPVNPWFIRGSLRISGSNQARAMLIDILRLVRIKLAVCNDFAHDRCLRRLVSNDAAFEFTSADCFFNEFLFVESKGLLERLRELRRGIR